MKCITVIAAVSPPLRYDDNNKRDISSISSIVPPTIQKVSRAQIHLKNILPGFIFTRHSFQIQETDFSATE